MPNSVLEEQLDNRISTIQIGEDCDSAAQSVVGEPSKSPPADHSVFPIQPESKSDIGMKSSGNLGDWNEEHESDNINGDGNHPQDVVEQRKQDTPIASVSNKA